jgi:surface protein
MFLNCNSFNQPLYSWNVSNVTSMNAMFQSCISFDRDISNWDVSNVTSMVSIFNESGLTLPNARAIWNSWRVQLAHRSSVKQQLLDSLYSLHIFGLNLT